MNDQAMPVWGRLWRYQAERFPLGRNGALIAVFAASGVSLSSVLGGRPLPGGVAFACAFLVAFGFFVQLRVADEVKDAEDDRHFRPERPVPRGLVSLRLLVSLAIGVAALQAGICLAFAPILLLPLAAVWGWMALMAVEFFNPAFLRRHALLYLTSHMMVMPLIDFWITAVDWLTRGGVPPVGLFAPLLLSYANGCVLEIGRKTWAPSAERPGVETYSVLWGARGAAAGWLGVVVLAFVLLGVTGVLAGAGPVITVLSVLVLAVAVHAGLAFRAHPDQRSQKLLDAVAGGWVLASYAMLGAAPVIIRSL
jgi:4-hydroxybenzoate polyprenyltransferase